MARSGAWGRSGTGLSGAPGLGGAAGRELPGRGGAARGRGADNAGRVGVETAKSWSVSIGGGTGVETVFVLISLMI